MQGRRKQVDEKIPEILRLFEQGLSCLQISKRVGVSQPTCAKYVRLAGRELKGMGVTTPEHVQDEMAELYLSDPLLTMEDVGVRFGCSRDRCRGALLRRGVKLRPGGRRPGSYPELYTYARDDTFFDVIDSEEKAYALGFVMTDGNVSQNEKQLSIGLKATDRDVLEQIRSALQYTGELHEYVQDGYPSIKLVVCSRPLTAALRRMGIGPAKSLTVQPPLDYVPEGLRRHFWRGAVDGDGWLHKTSAKYCAWHVGLCGTKAVVSAFKEFVASAGIESCASVLAQVRHGAALYGIEYSGTYLPQRVAEILYDGASIYLARKKAVADDLAVRRFTHVKKHDLSKEEVEAAYLEHGSWAKAARALGLKSAQVLWQVALRHGLVKRKGR